MPFESVVCLSIYSELFSFCVFMGETLRETCHESEKHETGFNFQDSTGNKGETSGQSEVSPVVSHIMLKAFFVYCMERKAIPISFFHQQCNGNI